MTPAIIAALNASFLVKTIVFSELKINLDTSDNKDIAAETIKIRVMVVVNAA